jgi:hypothetical protein
VLFIGVARHIMEVGMHRIDGTVSDVDWHVVRTNVRLKVIERRLV